MKEQFFNTSNQLYIPYELKKIVSLLKMELFFFVLGILSWTLAIVLSGSPINNISTKMIYMLICSISVLFPLLILIINEKIIHLLEHSISTSIKWLLFQIYGNIIIALALLIYMVSSSSLTLLIIISLVFIVSILLTFAVLKILAFKKVKSTTILWNKVKDRQFSFKNLSLDSWMKGNVKHILKHYAFFLVYFVQITVLLGWLAIAAFGSRNFDLLALLPKDFPSVTGLEEVSKNFGGFGYLMLAVETDEADNEREKFEKENQVKLLDEYKMDSAGKVILIPRINNEGKVIAIDEKAVKKTFYYEKTNSINGKKAGSKKIKWEANLTKTKEFITKVTQKLEKHPNISFCITGLPIDFILENKALFADIGDLALIYGRAKEKKRKGFNSRIGFDMSLEEDKGINIKDIKDKYLTSSNRTISKDGFYLSGNNKMMGILIKPNKPSLDVQFCKDIYRDTKKIVDQTLSDMKAKDQSFPLIKIGYGGRYKRKPDAQAIIQRDLNITTFLGLLFIVGIVTLYFRKLSALLFIGLPLVLGVLWTYGVTFLRFEHINILTAFLSIILLGLGVDFGIHFLSRYYEERKKGKSLDEAIYVMLSRTGKATLTAVATTIASFFALTLTEFKGFNEFGFIGLIGLIMAYLSMFYLLTTLLVVQDKLKFIGDYIQNIFEVKEVKTSVYIFIGLILIANLYFIIAYYSDHNPESIFNIPKYYVIIPYLILIKALIVLLDWLNKRRNQVYFMERLFKKPMVILYSIVLLFVLSLIFGREVYFDYNFRKLEGMNMDSMLIEDKIGEQFNLSLSPSAVLANNESEEEEIYKAYKKVKRNNGKSSTIDRIDALTAYVPEHQTEKLVIIEDLKKLIQEFNDQIVEDKFQEDAQKTKTQLKDWEKDYNLDTVSRILPEEIPDELKRLFISTKNPENPKRVVLIFPYPYIGNDGQLIKKYANEIRGIKLKGNRKISAAGENLVFADILFLVENDAPFIIFSVIVLTILIVLIDFRNLKSVLIVITPLIVGITFLFGLMYLFDVQFNILNVVVFPVIIGIGVDSSVHLYHRYLDEGVGNVFTALRHTGLAVTFASLTTILGFGSMIAANHHGLNSIGWLAVLGIGATYVISILLLPTILVILEKSGKTAKSKNYFEKRFDI